MTALLSVNNLARHYAVRKSGAWFGQRDVLRAVDGVSFELAAGRTLGLVGESGCGKSTTAKMVLGLLAPSRGNVQFEGAAVPHKRTSAWRQLRKRMQMVYQDPLSVLDRRLPVINQVTEPLIVLGGASASDQKHQAREIMAAVGLTPHLFERYPHELSGGQRQRVVLARALILKPSLLVCDEPISALDVSIQAQVINLLGDLQQKLGVAMLFISHDLKVVRHVCDDVAVMYLGRIVEQGSAEQLFRDPAHPYTRALISAIPSPRRKQQTQRIILQGEPPNPIQVPSGCAFHPRCAHATAVCREIRPELAIVDGARRVACHLHATTVPHT
ncbi:peptide ABC transporter ATP-binding protein [Pollutimonas nitritireducens]|uniref:Peptide ABC transporter ATP-binding protein n=1 Tax=Pollutimonas nitritireducens TaxID=2045209 RepID=A0A2N4UE32_9BURK|nr:oligopeptide/dipeptide ABC transporter ATP-binding protein [Pollutimonas nitritireducens]PLC53272.1 peptide ABC transporter ATP-binding protein [Pollutimonas nitritireducens]